MDGIGMNTFILDSMRRARKLAREMHVVSMDISEVFDSVFIRH